MMMIADLVKDYRLEEYKAIIAYDDRHTSPPLLRNPVAGDTSPLPRGPRNTCSEVLHGQIILGHRSWLHSQTPQVVLDCSRSQTKVTNSAMLRLSVLGKSSCAANNSAAPLSTYVVSLRCILLIEQSSSLPHQVRRHQRYCSSSLLFTILRNVSTTGCNR